jgi:hypothetical protein
MIGTRTAVVAAVCQVQMPDRFRSAGEARMSALLGRGALCSRPSQRQSAQRWVIERFLRLFSSRGFHLPASGMEGTEATGRSRARPGIP